MDDLFSHAAVTPGLPAARPDIVASVAVPTPIDHAWAGLTEHLHLWWPADELSRWGEGSFFDLEAKALVETSVQEDEYVWGEMVDNVPGRWLELVWRHVGSASATGVRFDLRVSDHADESSSRRDADRGTSGRSEQIGTALTVTHSGWTSADSADLYEVYRTLWPTALQRYRRFMGGV